MFSDIVVFTFTFIHVVSFEFIYPSFDLFLNTALRFDLLRHHLILAALKVFGGRLQLSLANFVVLFFVCCFLFTHDVSFSFAAYFVLFSLVLLWTISTFALGIWLALLLVVL